MKSIREIYKTGKGPSSSHTMGPERAANYFKNAHPQADSFRVILYGSLSKTGVGHGTDRVLREVLAPVPTEIVFSDEALPASAHPNTMDLIALKNGAEADRLRVESIGGGDIRIPGQTDSESEEVYVEHSFAEIADFCKWRYIQTLSDYVELNRGAGDLGVPSGRLADHEAVHRRGSFQNRRTSRRPERPAQGKIPV